eukprot:365571-Chlamydomonas_euryale.AAC.1
MREAAVVPAASRPRRAFARGRDHGRRLRRCCRRVARRSSCSRRVRRRRGRAGTGATTRRGPRAAVKAVKVVAVRRRRIELRQRHLQLLLRCVHGSSVLGPHCTRAAAWERSAYRLHGVH